ncbi:hypothetical protein HK405_009937 [Cladochytrium tenue]|nr:hypothetical protein HK405_009937 [Cladochytrium tenue]
MAIHHNLFDDLHDGFCCGRAFGGSRIAVVSTARYGSALNVTAGLDLEHAWPASHCATYINRMLLSARSERRCRVRPAAAQTSPPRARPLQQRPRQPALTPTYRIRRRCGRRERPALPRRVSLRLPRLLHAGHRLARRGPAPAV